MGGALSYATGESDNAAEAAWAGATQLIPDSGAAGGKTYSNAVSGNESENNRVNRGKMASGKYPGGMSNGDFPPLSGGYRYGKAGKVGRKTRRKNKGKRRKKKQSKKRRRK